MDQASAIQAVIGRIHEACQAPPLAPQDYRAVFEAAADEINENGLAGAQTLTAIAERVATRGANVRKEDVRFVLDVVSEADPWFETGATANLFAGRFRNFVVSRCRDRGLSLSSDDLDLIDAWFTGSPMPDLTSGRRAPPPQARRATEASAEVASPAAALAAASRPLPQAAAAPVAPAPAVPAAPQTAREGGSQRWWSLDEGRQHVAAQRAAPAPAAAGETEDDFPRIVRTRRG